MARVSDQFRWTPGRRNDDRRRPNRGEDMYDRYDNHRRGDRHR
jgi:hypothetical protein